MKLNHRDALNILGCKPGMEYTEIQRMYRKCSAQYHPDRNPAGLEMMKLVNAAWEALQDYSGGMINEEESDWNLGDELNNALNAIIGLGLNIEICGSWIWVSGDTKPHKEVLKAAGYRWAPKKCMWSYCGSEVRTSSRGKFSMDDIRMRHGSATVKPAYRTAIE